MAPPHTSFATDSAPGVDDQAALRRAGDLGISGAGGAQADGLGGARVAQAAGFTVVNLRAQVPEEQGGKVVEGLRWRQASIAALGLVLVLGVVGTVGSNVGQFRAMASRPVELLLAPKGRTLDTQLASLSRGLQKSTQDLSGTEGQMIQNELSAVIGQVSALKNTLLALQQNVHSAQQPLSQHGSHSLSAETVESKATAPSPVYHRAVVDPHQVIKNSAPKQSHKAPQSKDPISAVPANRAVAGVKAYQEAVARQSGKPNTIAPKLAKAFFADSRGSGDNHLAMIPSAKQLKRVDQFVTSHDCTWPKCVPRSAVPPGMTTTSAETLNTAITDHKHLSKARVSAAGQRPQAQTHSKAKPKHEPAAAQSHKQAVAVDQHSSDQSHKQAVSVDKPAAAQSHEHAVDQHPSDQSHKQAVSVHKPMADVHAEATRKIKEHKAVQQALLKHLKASPASAPAAEASPAHGINAGLKGNHIAVKQEHGYPVDEHQLPAKAVGNVPPAASLPAKQQYKAVATDHQSSKPQEPFQRASSRTSPEYPGRPRNAHFVYRLGGPFQLEDAANLPRDEQDLSGTTPYYDAAVPEGAQMSAWDQGQLHKDEVPTELRKSFKQRMEDLVSGRTLHSSSKSVLKSLAEGIEGMTSSSSNPERKVGLHRGHLWGRHGTLPPWRKHQAMSGVSSQMLRAGSVAQSQSMLQGAESDPLNANDQYNAWSQGELRHKESSFRSFEKTLHYHNSDF